MNKPKLKTPPNPEFAYMDLDAPLFAAASAGEQVMYSAVTPDGEVIGSFTSAKDYQKWLEQSEAFGMDTVFCYGGDLSELNRETSYEIKDFQEAAKTFDKIIKKWVKRSGCTDWTGYISKASGEKNFRYDIATIKPYKGSRAELRKPHHLEELRKYAAAHPKIKIPRGNVEVDDAVCAMAQKKRYKGCVVGVDKDARGVHDTHIFIPEEMDQPQFSSKKIVGRLYQEGKKGKVVGYGTLFWLFQTLKGDPVDTIPGCRGVGEVAAYEALKEFDGVSSDYLVDAIKTVAKVFAKVYGKDKTFTYKHHTTEEELVVSGKEVFIEMSHLVYMKKSRSDECFWIPIIEEIWEGLECE